MYAIYGKKAGQLSLFEEDEEEFLDLNEAEEILRQLQPVYQDRGFSLMPVEPAAYDSCPS